MVYLLAVFAIAAPIVLVVQTLRGRVRLQCCAVDVSKDARMRPYPEDSTHLTARPTT